ncbi:MAG: 4-(cytidine 5'-diphospho)-2-C-methyl-D-erythritol kinase, partial [Candidatus Omnitrophota bacterium]|nr:4-(cytidine 5'-diphospho)-2-C-methyl-D-erythritol kinase [Candidatus Omnitrophota bacterium]
MHSITVKAPAKVNIFLKVLNKRKDSYHNIVTVFDRISLADTIKISKISKGIILKSDKPITRYPEDNLCFKAAEAILRYGKVKSGVRIDINKKIPLASGLGGGSSDAAAVLRGINKLFDLKLSGRILLNMAKELGADVPFFVLNTAFAIGKGRGDELKVVRPGKRFWHLIIKAGKKTSTGDIYGAFDETSKHLTPGRENVKIQIPSEFRMDYEQAESMLHNDLETADSLKKGVTGRILKDLARLLGKKVIVSGSGPSLFCLYGTRREAIDAKDAILRNLSARSRSGWQIFVA